MARGHDRMRRDHVNIDRIDLIGRRHLQLQEPFGPHEGAEGLCACHWCKLLLTLYEIYEKAYLFYC